jgi:hypothetical protein
MPNINKRPAINTTNTTVPTKRRCHTDKLPPSHLSQLQSALSAATTLLATLADLAKTLAAAKNAITPSHTLLINPASKSITNPLTNLPAYQSSNRAIFRAIQAPPAVLATAPERTDGVLVDLAILTPAPPAVLAMTPEQMD